MANQVDTQRERIVRARTQLILEFPFFGLLATKLNLVADATCRTLWTDGVSMGFNANHVASLNDTELIGEVVHLVFHLIAGHPWRQGDRPSLEWNMACDHVVNHLAHQEGFEVPSAVPLDPEFVGFSAEMVFAKLAAQSEPEPEPPTPPDSTSAEEEREDGKGESGDGEDEAQREEPDDSPAAPESPAGEDESTESTQPPGSDAPAPSGVEAGEDMGPGEVRKPPEGVKASELADEWSKAIVEASLGQGALSAGFSRLVEEAARGIEDWKDILCRLVQQAVGADDFTWARPNRRYLEEGFYLPSLQGQTVKTIVIVRDTSGSVVDSLLAAFNARVEHILDEVAPEQVIVLDADAEVCRAQVLEQPYELTEFARDAKGGGGTQFSPAFEWVASQPELDVTCLVYLTDLMGGFPVEEPEYPVFWVHPQGFSQPVPFGELVEMAE